ncbi:hypothetical protein, partial [Nostoc linckia]|uniref:hypothetical protein n=1 Tax=Nostoc linckia TaxID=92942 RepID=UPI000C035F18
FLVRQIVFAAPSEQAAAGCLDVGPASGIDCDPGPVGLWTLQGFLSRRSFDDVLAEQPEPVAMFNEGQKLVLALSTDLRDDLAGMRGWRAARVARRWSKTDEVRAERLRSTQVKQLTRDLSLLARTAKKDNEQIYLWVDVSERALFPSA